MAKTMFLEARGTIQSSVRFFFFSHTFTPSMLFGSDLAPAPCWTSSIQIIKIILIVDQRVTIQLSQLISCHAHVSELVLVKLVLTAYDPRLTLAGECTVLHNKSTSMSLLDDLNEVLNGVYLALFFYCGLSNVKSERDPDLNLDKCNAVKGSHVGSIG